MISTMTSCLAWCFGTESNSAINSVTQQAALADREMVFKYLLEELPKSSQTKNADSIQLVIEQIQHSGVCKLEGSDIEIRPGSVGLQCLFEEMFLANSEAFQKGDFEIHTTMPSTPCCKLPNEEAKNTLLVSFSDADRLVTIDGRSSSLDAISDHPKATLHLTYTEAGFNKRTEGQQLTLTEHWMPKLHTTCIQSHDTFPAEVNGATYRLLAPSGNEIFFGIQATQAADANGKCFVVHLGTKDQPEVKAWLDNLENHLEPLGHTLFAQ